MARGPMLDALGASRHIMGGGMEQTKIFCTDQDWEDFLNSLADLFIVWTSKYKKTKIITARDMTEKEKRFYRSRKE